MQNKDNLIWIDLEFTGLDFNKDKILEIATIVTDKDLNILEKGPNLAIKTSKEILENMDTWNKEHHGESGLIQKCLDSNTTLEKAENLTLEFLKKYTLPDASPLCGNTVSADRRMLYKDMPKLEKHLHYRHIDVTTIKELAKRWKKDFVEYKKEETHTALKDIEESIEELRYYKSFLFNLD